MDWAVTARTGGPHVRDLVADRELETWALADLSASMDFGTVAMEKRDLAVAVVGAVGLLTDRPGNRLGACLLTGSGLPDATGAARAGRHPPAAARSARRRGHHPAPAPRSTSPPG